MALLPRRCRDSAVVHIDTEDYLGVQPELAAPRRLLLYLENINK